MISGESRESLISCLENGGVSEGALVFVHSFLGAFGILDFDVSDVLDVLEGLVGKTGGLIFPTYNYSFFDGAVVNPFDMESQVGILTETARKRPEYTTIPHPVYSHVVWGARAEKAINKTLHEGSAFGVGSVFHFMYQEKADICFFGTPWESCTFVHYIEESIGVPYRFTKEFFGAVTDGTCCRPACIRVYSRDLSLDPQLCLGAIKSRMEKLGLVKNVEFGRGMVSLVNSSDLFREVKTCLRDDAYALVTLGNKS